MRSWPLIALAVLASAPASAQALEPITNRNYAIDLYEGTALGNITTIAMGGAAAANASGSSGTLINPSAAAVRSTTDRDSWSWDYHLDYLNGGLSADYDNDGLGTGQRTSLSYATAGFALRVQNWAGAITGTIQSVPLSLDAANGSIPPTGQTLRFRAAVAKWFPKWDIAIGAGLQIAELDVRQGCDQFTCPALFSIDGVGLEAGAQWIPRLENFRLGAALATPIAGGNVTASECNPLDCQGYILPDQVVSAWRVTTGLAYRWAPSLWNQTTYTDFRDERALTAVLDLVIVGPSANAYGLDAFGMNELERSGRHTSWSPRGGVEYEILPGRLRLRGGSYWEPGRFEGVGGRVHGTFGIEVRAFEFHAWGLRRGRLTLTGDVADRYDNLGISIGLWH